jgi:hypothetical protein
MVTILELDYFLLIVRDTAPMMFISIASLGTPEYLLSRVLEGRVNLLLWEDELKDVKRWLKGYG